MAEQVKTLEDLIDEHVVEWEANLIIDGEIIATISSFSLEGMEEDERKLIHAYEDWKNELEAELEEDDEYL